MTFRQGFVWGAATSAYQIEGGWNADGKGPSVWDMTSRHAGMVHEGHTGDIACDHYHRYEDDVKLMQNMGLNAYRFSVAWSRVLPDGTGRVNGAGLGFYDRLVDSLLAAGVEPWLTLFHWDFPQRLHEKGNWLNRDSAQWFEEYAQVMADRLGDRVTHWMTLNEPQIFLGPSEGEGFHPPGNKLNHSQRLLAAHHALLAHGRAAQVIRARAKKPPQVGWAPIGRIKVPWHAGLFAGAGKPGVPSAADIDAARRRTHEVPFKDFWNNAWFADPAILGHYPEDGLRLYGDDAPKVLPGDMETIRQTLDFYGINVYDAEVFRAGPDGTPQRVHFPPGHPQNALRWFIIPEALYWGPKFLYERYKVPMVITENGMSGLDWIDAAGRVRDFGRIDYTRRYLLELRRAARDGTDIRGYFHWSLLDNFEWQQGYKERFGLIHVDFKTLARTPKESSRWYKRVIESNGAALDDTAA
ncbi:MAG: beta-glucosidase [Planctomycetes bacterium]|nr:beta-glucosidase [Planctomycetota bacterium]